MLLAGSAATCVLAIILYCVVPLVGTLETADYGQLFIAEVSDAAAPFEVGDRITAIDGRQAHKRHDILMAVLLNPDRDVAFTITRGGREMEVLYQGTADTETGEISGFSLVSGAFVRVLDGFPAQEAGLRTGDRIVRIDSREIPGWKEMMEVVQALPEGQAAEVVVMRGWEEMLFRVTPVMGVGSGEEMATPTIIAAQ